MNTDRMAKIAYQMAFPDTLTVVIPIANKVGLIESIIINIIEEECYVNKKNRDDNFFRQNNWWTRFSTEKTVEHHPFLGSARTIQRVLKQLREDGYLISENFNESKLEKALWYRVNKEMLAEAFFTKEI